MGRIIWIKTPTIISKVSPANTLSNNLKLNDKILANSAINSKIPINPLCFLKIF